MGPKSTLWPLEPHTRGKHLVLKHYLDAWFPILGSWSGRILFIDGFAGPGEYESGEEGSPLIAIRTLREHRYKRTIKAEVRFVFIEKNKDRANHLATLMENWKDKLSEKCFVEVIHGPFDQTMSRALDHLSAQQKQLAPCLVMVDPFGVSGTPMSVIERILRNPRSEVYVSFMYESINRFRKDPTFARRLDELFGSEDWRKGVDIEDGKQRKTFFYSLYEARLRRAGANQVLHFDLYRGSRLIYSIFFGTQHPKGSDVMKRAMWKVAPFGDFQFRGTRSKQLTLIGIREPDFEPLRTALKEEFSEKGWVRIEQIGEFVASDRTDYHTGQVRKGALIPLEEAGEIEVDGQTRRRKCTYPDGTRLRFV